MDIDVETLDFATVNLIDKNGTKQTLNVLEDLQINKFDLESEMYTQPSKYMYYTSVLETVRAYKESASFALDQVWSESYEVARVTLVKQGVNRPTKDQIESWITTQQEYIDKKKKLDDYDFYVRKLQYIVKSFEQRKDMLVQLATDNRKQREYENAINQN